MQNQELHHADKVSIKTLKQITDECNSTEENENKECEKKNKTQVIKASHGSCEVINEETNAQAEDV